MLLRGCRGFLLRERPLQSCSLLMMTGIVHSEGKRQE